MMRSRRDCVGACRDIAGKARRCCPKRCSWRGIPMVEISILRQDMAAPWADVRVVRLSKTASRLSSGSPMPMNTTRVGQTPVVRWDSFATVLSCASISGVVRLRLKPLRPVWQNRHPIGQPTWVDRHTVRHVRMGMLTASMV